MGNRLQGQIGHTLVFGLSFIKTPEANRPEVELPKPFTHRIQSHQFPSEQMGDVDHVIATVDYARALHPTHDKIIGISQVLGRFGIVAR